MSYKQNDANQDSLHSPRPVLQFDVEWKKLTVMSHSGGTIQVIIKNFRMVIDEDDFDKELAELNDLLKNALDELLDCFLEKNNNSTINTPTVARKHNFYYKDKPISDAALLHDTSLGASNLAVPADSIVGSRIEVLQTSEALYIADTVAEATDTVMRVNNFDYSDKETPALSIRREYFDLKELLVLCLPHL